MKDEREGLPSASAYERIRDCPGSFYAERGMTDESSQMSRAGDIAHACLAGEVHIDELDDETAQTVAVIRTLELGLLKSLGFEDGIQSREVRLYLVEESAEEKIFSGKPDLIVFDEGGNRSLIVDYKTGPLPVAQAQSNMQLRALAVLLHANAENLKISGDPTREITTAIIQPRAPEPVTVCTYKDDDLWAAHYELINILSNATDPKAKRKATEKACRYCKAKPTCPEAQKTLMEIQKTENNLPAVPSADLLEKCAIAKTLIAKIEGNARKALEDDPCSIPGYYLKPGATRKAITNPEGVFFKSVIHGIDGSEFAGICDVNKSKLKALVKQKTGLKGKALDDAIAEILDGNTDEKTNKPSLAKDLSHE